MKMLKGKPFISVRWMLTDSYKSGTIFKLCLTTSTSKKNLILCKSTVSVAGNQRK